MTQRRREPEIIELGFNQQWGSYLCMIAAAVMLTAGLWLRNNAITATLPYEVPEVGIAVRYPARWLLDTTSAGVILRVQDAEAIPFKTSIQVSVAPVGTFVQRVLRDLTINRANQNSTYRVLRCSGNSYATLKAVSRDKLTSQRIRQLLRFTPVDRSRTP